MATLSYQWNTQRLYTSEGQVITAMLTPRGEGEQARVDFTDHSRMIDGTFYLDEEIAESLVEAKDFKSLRHYVMTEYDHGRYQYEGHHVERLD